MAMNIEDTNKYQLSVLLVTYNHEEFLHKALDGLFNQIFEGQIQLVIADDSSSDSTAMVTKAYETRDSRFVFKYLNNTNNLGITKNYQRGFAACTAEYVAILEGDDYWISPFKLQRQIEFLRCHWECNLCSTNYLIFDERSSSLTPRIAIELGHQLISARQLIADNIVGNFSTCMYRRESLTTLPPELFEIRSYDWIVNIYVSKSCMIGFLNEPLSVYRLHANGVWSNSSQIDKLRNQLELIPAYDALTNHIFKTEFGLLAVRLKKSITIAELQTHNLTSRLVPHLPNNLRDYLPPIVMKITAALMPPKLMRLIIKILGRKTT
jgi:glycosyltransferase involved in cell wall biosynthesis